MIRKAAFGRCLAAILLCLPGLCLAAKGQGTAAASFLNINVAPRPASLGEAFTGLSDDLGAVLFNPAGLAFLERQEVSLVHHQYFEGVKQEWGAYAYPTSRATFAGFFNMLFIQSFESYDQFDQPLGKKGAADAAYGGSMAVRLSDWLSVGGSGKYISSRLDTRRASAIAVDGGVLLKPMDWLSVGAAVFNVGSPMKYIDESFDLPAAARAGVAVRPLRRTRNESEEWDEITIVADGVLPRFGTASGGGGIEYVSANFMSLRAGARISDAGPGYTLGMGLHINRSNPDKPQLSFDYAFIDGGELNYMHRVGVSARFGASRSRNLSETSFWRKVDKDVARPAPSMQPLKPIRTPSEKSWVR